MKYLDSVVVLLLPVADSVVVVVHVSFDVVPGVLSMYKMSYLVFF